MIKIDSLPVNINAAPIKAAISLEAKLQLEQQLWHHLKLKASGSFAKMTRRGRAKSRTGCAQQRSPSFLVSDNLVWSSGNSQSKLLTSNIFFLTSFNLFEFLGAGMDTTATSFNDIPVLINVLPCVITPRFLRLWFALNQPLRQQQ